MKLPGAWLLYSRPPTINDAIIQCQQIHHLHQQPHHIIIERGVPLNGAFVILSIFAKQFSLGIVSEKRHTEAMKQTAEFIIGVNMIWYESILSVNDSNTSDKLLTKNNKSKLYLEPLKLLINYSKDNIIMRNRRRFWLIMKK